MEASESKNLEESSSCVGRSVGKGTKKKKGENGVRPSLFMV